MRRAPFVQQLRYRFDNLMARGVGAQIAMLALATLVLVVVAAFLLVLVGIAPAGDDGERPSFGRLIWQGLMHTLDSGAVGGDTGSWAYLFVWLGVTIGGIFVLSALVGILTGGFGQLVENLRKGKSQVLETGHTVILGWNSKLPDLLRELAEANANQRSAAIVVLADRDKVAMDDDVRAILGKSHLRIITRTGSPLSLPDLARVAPDQAKAVIVLAPDSHGDDLRLAAAAADTLVLKTLLAVYKLGAVRDGRIPVVAEVQSEETVRVARMVVGQAAALILTPRLISRLLVQTGRQSGLSAVYTELFTFEGDEIYTAPAHGLTGKTFREALFAFDDSALVGIATDSGQLLLPPPLDRAIVATDRVVAISRDDDTVRVNGRRTAVDESALAPLVPHAPGKPERTLVLGASPLLPLILAELDTYLADGSETLVVGEASPPEKTYAHMRVEFRAGDMTERALLDALDPVSFDHVLVLTETTDRSAEVADARTLVTLLHLRDIARTQKRTIKVTTEMLDNGSRELAHIAEADDFIVSNSLVSLVVAQVAENRLMNAVFDALLAHDGHEIYLKPARDYVKPDVDLDFYAVVEAAARRNEIAIGYRVAANAQNPDSRYGVVLNPRKGVRMRLAAADRVVVLAER